MKNFFILLLTFSFQSFADEYTHSQWIDMFKEKDINNKIELIKLDQTRLNIKESLGRIVPSLNIGTIVDTAVTGPIGLLGGLSNFLGFLMPSRWFTWNESKMYYLSQYHAYIATRGNLILMGDELFLSLKKTYKIQEVLELVANELTPLTKSIAFRERIGELPKGSSARIKAKLYALESDLLNLRSIIDLYLIEINRLITDQSFSKVTSIKYDEDRPTSSFNWDYESLKEISAELKSYDALIAASKYSKKSRVWSFLDFSGEGFGLGYFARNKISTLEIEKLKLRKKQESIALNAQFISINTLDKNTNDQINLLTDALISSSERKEQILVDYTLTGNIDADDYIENLDNYIKFSILSISNKVKKEYLQAKKERMSLVGYYENLDDIIPERNIKKLKRYQRKEDRMFN